ncbi:MAG TPA: DoxX family protein [Polyangiaceae bacterium]
MNSKTSKHIAYWLTTALLALDFGAGGVFQMLRGPQVMQAMTHLGYPAYFVTLLGVWKVLGAVALVVPGFPRLKEWAYAGVFFDLTSAAVSLAAVGDGVGAALLPLLFAGLALASYALRPSSRRYEVVSPSARSAKREHPATSQLSVSSGID